MVSRGCGEYIIIGSYSCMHAANTYQPILPTQLFWRAIDDFDDEHDGECDEKSRRENVFIRGKKMRQVEEEKEKTSRHAEKKEGQREDW